MSRHTVDIPNQLTEWAVDHKVDLSLLLENALWALIEAVDDTMKQTMEEPPGG